MASRYGPWLDATTLGVVESDLSILLLAWRKSRAPIQNFPSESTVLFRNRTSASASPVLRLGPSIKRGIEYLVAPVQSLEGGAKVIDSSASTSFYIFSPSQCGFIPRSEDSSWSAQDPVKGRRSSPRFSRLSAMPHPDLSAPEEFFVFQSVSDLISGSHRHGQRQPQAQIYEMSSRDDAVTGQTSPASQSTPGGHSTPDTLVGRDSPNRPNLPSPTASTYLRVSVEQVVADWKALSRHFSALSERHPSRSQRRCSGGKDLEKQASGGSSMTQAGDWSLENTLREGRAADEEAEIKPKHIFSHPMM